MRRCHCSDRPIKSSAYFWSFEEEFISRREMVAVSMFVLLIGVLLSLAVEAKDSKSKAFDGQLEIDQAYINVTTHDAEDLFIMVYGIDTDCWKCKPQLLNKDKKPANASKGFDVIVDKTSYEYKLVVSMNTSKGVMVDICSSTKLYGERGWYEFMIHKVRNKMDTYSCAFKTIREPEDTYLPVLVAFLILVAMAALWILLTELARRNMLPFCCKDTDGIINADLGSPKPLSSSEATSDHEEQVTPPRPKKSKRLRSLDTFRGIAITIMVFVNYGGGKYYFFEHARWNGLHVADLVFPWFIWIMGVSMTLSFRSLMRCKVNKSKVLMKIVRRSLILLALGLFTSNYGDLAHYRIPGVLQRFAICYFVVAVMQLYMPPQYEDPQQRWWDPIRDVVGLWGQWLLMLLLLLVYIVITYAVPVPGCPTGYVGPGGIGEGFPKAEKCTGGMAGYIDRSFFGLNHIYQRGEPKKLYQTVVPHDPEGCLGTLTSVVLVFFGVQYKDNRREDCFWMAKFRFVYMLANACVFECFRKSNDQVRTTGFGDQEAGRILFTYKDHKSRIIRWLLWGALLGVIAIGLTGGTKNEGIIPINKNLWSVTFILATGATAFILLSTCYVLNDVIGWWNGAPFFYAGMNSILVYVGHGILQRHFPFSWDMDKYAGTHAEKLAMSMVGTALWLIISYYLFTIKFFLKI